MIDLFSLMIVGGVGWILWIWRHASIHHYQWFNSEITKVWSRICRPYQTAKKKNRMRDEIAPAILSMTNALKAGLPLHTAIEHMASIRESALAQECGWMMADLRSGRSMEETLGRFKERLPIEEVIIWVDAMLAVRAVGGNLVGILTSIRKTFLAQRQLRGKLSVYLSYSRYQFRLMLVIPWVTSLAFLILFPDYMRPLITHPVGWGIMTASFLLWGIGGVMVYQMSRLEV